MTNGSAKPRSGWPSADYVESDHVFTRVERRALPPADAVAGCSAVLSVEAGLPRLTAHGLRHTSATLMLANGVPPKVAAERLGHADADPLHQPLQPRHARPCSGRRPTGLGKALFS